MTTLSRCGLSAACVAGAMVAASAQTPALRSAPLPPPLPVPGQSSADSFRALLALSPEQRAQKLSAEPEERRRVLEKALREYDALPPEERELRLRALDLRLQISFLIRLPPSNRADRLKLLPEADRPVVEAKVKRWSQFPPTAQKELVENERVLRLWIGHGTFGHVTNVNLSGPSAAQFGQINKDLERWQQLSPSRQREIQRRYHEVFDVAARGLPVPPPVLPPGTNEQQQVREALAKMSGLSAQQREACISGFEKLAELSPEERARFLKNAERWQAMPPEDRAVWRRVAVPPPPLPKLPASHRLPSQGARPAPATQFVTTNAN